MSGVLMQEPVYGEQDVLRGLQQYEKQAKMNVRKLIFYPYYLFEYELGIRSLLKLKGKTACTIDALSGYGALIDVQPEFSHRQIEAGQAPAIQIDEDEAREAAGQFIFENAMSKAKFVTVPDIQLLTSTLFYRPFWLVEYRLEAYEPKSLIVDAISGSYHPL
ncbi:hypothetical protein ACFPRA_11375 [Sporosarcina soli]|uniref:Uncharacterized protein n=1 Tax=Sporosarcina soli TaxID=334736 RepID=A0ABW0TL22_9BACL